MYIKILARSKCIHLDKARFYQMFRNWRTSCNKISNPWIMLYFAQHEALDYVWELFPYLVQPQSRLQQILLLITWKSFRYPEFIHKFNLGCHCIYFLSQNELIKPLEMKSFWKVIWIGYAYLALCSAVIYQKREKVQRKLGIRYWT